LDVEPGSDDHVFVRTNGAPLDNRSLQRLVANWLTAAGVPAPPGEKAHLFRHTYGIAQIDRGTTLPELQALMGHENISTTSTYLRVAADGLHHTARARERHGPGA
jgi:site-specific recombinase XerD